MAHRDALDRPIAPGTVVAGSFREFNIAVLRTGTITKAGYSHDPHIMDPPDVDVPVVWVRWETTTGDADYLPRRATKVAARKVVRL